MSVLLYCMIVFLLQANWNIYYNTTSHSTYDLVDLFPDSFAPHTVLSIGKGEEQQLSLNDGGSCGFALSLFLSAHMACFLPREAHNNAKRELVKTFPFFTSPPTPLSISAHCLPERRTSDFNTWPHNAGGQRHTSSNFTHKMKGKLTLKLFEAAALGSGQLRRQSPNPTTLWATKRAREEQGCWKLEECRRPPAEGLAPDHLNSRTRRLKRPKENTALRHIRNKVLKTGLCDLQFQPSRVFDGLLWKFYFIFILWHVHVE